MPLAERWRGERRGGSGHISGNGALRPNHCGHSSDRVHRLYRCPHRIESARGSFRAAEPAGARARCAGSARARLAHRLQLHMDFPHFEEFLNSRIHIFWAISRIPISASVDDDYRQLVRTTDSVIHCAASLNRKSEKSCLNVNLRGTLEVIQLAMRARDDHGLRRFSHVSTVAVAGQRANEVVQEDSVDRLESLGLRSVRAHQEILRAHGSPACCRMCRARFSDRASCWATAVALKRISSTWFALLFFSRAYRRFPFGPRIASTLFLWITWPTRSRRCTRRTIRRTRFIIFLPARARRRSRS